MRVIISDPISEEGLRILKDSNIEVIDGIEQNIEQNYDHIKTANGWTRWVVTSGCKVLS